MADTALGDDLVREIAHPLDRPFQHNRLDTLIMVQMRVHGGDRELMVGVLNIRQTFGELTFVMIIDIREIGHAGATGVVRLGTALQVRAQDIAHRLAAGGVSPLFDEFIKRIGEPFVE